MMFVRASKTGIISSIQTIAASLFMERMDHGRFRLVVVDDEGRHNLDVKAVGNVLIVEQSTRLQAGYAPAGENFAGRVAKLSEVVRRLRVYREEGFQADDASFCAEHHITEPEWEAGMYDELVRAHDALLGKGVQS